MKLNKPLIRKMIKRIETKPETYYQGNYVVRGTNFNSWIKDGRPDPVCGTVACLAGEAIICSEKSIRKGITKLVRLDNKGDTKDVAERLTGIGAWTGVFRAAAVDWPSPYREQWDGAKTYKGKARAAVNLLKAILRTDGKILE